MIEESKIGENRQSQDITEFLASGVAIQFVSEQALARRLGDNYWINMPCGHDCCTCNAECK
jgi:hypothetical protein